MRSEIRARHQITALARTNVEDGGGDRLARARRTDARQRPVVAISIGRRLRERTRSRLAGEVHARDSAARTDLSSRLAPRRDGSTTTEGRVESPQPPLEISPDRANEANGCAMRGRLAMYGRRP